MSVALLELKIVRSKAVVPEVAPDTWDTPDTTCPLVSCGTMLRTHNLGGTQPRPRLSWNRDKVTQGRCDSVLRESENRTARLNSVAKTAACTVVPEINIY